MNIIWQIILKAALPRIVNLIIDAMQESAHEHDNEITDLDAGRFIAHKDHIIKKVKVNLKSSGGGRLFGRH